MEKENDAYPSGSGNIYKIKLNPNTEIKERNDLKDFAEIKFNFINLGSFESIPLHEKIGKTF